MPEVCTVCRLRAGSVPRSGRLRHVVSLNEPESDSFRRWKARLSLCKSLPNRARSAGRASSLPETLKSLPDLRADRG
ncbi:hypothetical protein MUP00_05975 [Candidatus Bathyarchaeota archaeon]|nr:hypothetical protein [Candidatus Bathyarchaeota archaeon]